MKKRTEKSMTWTLGILVGSQFLLVLLFFLLRPGDTDLFSKGTLRLETGPSAETSLLLAHAHPRGDSLFIQGRLRAESDTSIEQKGTIRISVVSPDGAILEEASGVYQLSRSLEGAAGHSPWVWREFLPRIAQFELPGDPISKGQIRLHRTTRAHLNPDTCPKRWAAESATPEPSTM